jgi:hypothetical protein
LLLTAIYCFAAAAVGGLLLALRILSQQRAPLALALLHGGAGAAGLALLALVVLTGEGFSAPALALTILGGNALIGLYLFSRHLGKRRWPKAVVVLHGLAAAIGLGILIVSVLSSP